LEKNIFNLDIANIYIILLTIKTLNLKNKMKKLFILFTCVVFFSACNFSATETTCTSTEEVCDSTVVVTSTETVDTSTNTIEATATK
tara:strand:- start:230 stop:490 length:261 start_codon:yes stop_codon:yes gene_type:complete